MIGRRLHQLWRATRARLNSDDWRFVLDKLYPSELALFSQMAVYDQRHCIDTARTVMRLARARGTGPASLPVLIKAALLHDIGKVTGDIGLWDRCFIVILNRISRSLLHWLAEKGQADQKNGHRGFAYACYVQLHHPRRGAYMARAFGVNPRVVELLKIHHQPQGHTLEAWGRILQEADQAN